MSGSNNYIIVPVPLLVVALVLLLTQVVTAGSASADWSRFAGHLRCPFAHLWLEHGPEAAVGILDARHNGALLQSEQSSSSLQLRRNLQQSTASTFVVGSCSYTNPFTDTTDCTELRGGSWTVSTAADRCASFLPGASGELSPGEPCPLPDSLAGWCVAAGGAEATPLSLLTTSTTCNEVRESCEGWGGGSFQPAEACQVASNNGVEPVGPSSSWTNGDGGVPLCTIAPGPIGAAHQLGKSPGYSNNCEGTPAQQSPFMWPLRWSAEVETRALPFESDQVTFESRGRTSYMLDRNWKRSDIRYQNGVQFTVGQSPCPEEDRIEGDPRKCRRHPRNSTMIHRGNKMFFFDYADGGVDTITNCTWLDLSVIGNVRPDWFMDARGASTDVQYLGNSHVYHLGQPKLVKQWRKKDFASQYFTMSMQMNAGDDGVHWPLILNIPGEGFGDDMLQHYHNHTLLTDDDESLFLLDQQYEADGGTCVNIGSGGSGPPTGQFEHVPSNLEVEDVGWRSIVYTASPVWEGPPASSETGRGESRAEVTVAPGVSVAYCARDGAVRISTSFEVGEPVWAAVTERETEECLMTPRGGGPGHVVFAQPQPDGSVTLGEGELQPALKNFANAEATHAEFLAGLSGEVEGGSVEYVDGVMSLTFSLIDAAEPLHLSFAYGEGAELGYHATRECFELTDIPDCDASPANSLDSCPDCSCVSEATASAARASASALSALLLAGCLALAVAALN